MNSLWRLHQKETDGEKPVAKNHPLYRRNLHFSQASGAGGATGPMDPTVMCCPSHAPAFAMPAMLLRCPVGRGTHCTSLGIPPSLMAISHWSCCSSWVFFIFILHGPLCWSPVGDFFLVVVQTFHISRNFCSKPFHGR